MIRLILALLLIVCPSALGQSYQIKCEGDWCVIHRDALQVLVAAASLNCGPTR